MDSLRHDLARMIRARDVAALTRALDASPDQVRATDREGYTLLHVAAQSLEVESVDLLLARGADVNAQGLRQDTPLMCALEKPVLPNGGTLSGIVNGAFVTQRIAPAPAAPIRMRVVRTLLDRGALTNPPKDEARMPRMALYGYHPPLTKAATLGDTALVRLLLERGADVNGRCFAQSTALIAAVNAGHAEAVEVLLDAGADPKARDHNRQTALFRCPAAASQIVMGASLPVDDGQPKHPVDGPRFEVLLARLGRFHGTDMRGACGPRIANVAIE